MSNIDPNTGRPCGDHGTAQNALDYALDVIEDWAEMVDFLTAWRDGAAFEDWPEYYDWLLIGEGFGK
jgi:hypothetical protein